MKGILVYKKEDYEKNRSFASWLLSELSAKNLETELMLFEEMEEKTPFQCDFVINRAREYNLSLAFELGGVPVFNSGEITLLGNNKLAGYRYAKTRGFPFADIAVFPEKGKKLIAKPIYGHGGEGIYEYLGEKPEKDYLYQELISDYLGDVRFYIIGNEIVYAVLRKKSNEKLCSNFSQGNEFELFHYSEKIKQQVQEFISGLEIGYAGIDFLVKKDGSLLFNEIEDAVGSRMLSVLGMNDTVERFVSYIERTLKKNLNA